MAKGFKKNYFSLRAMTATNAGVILQKIITSVRFYRYNIIQYESSDDPPDELLENKTSTLFQVKPCYCNMFFACLAHKVLRLSRIKKPPVCKCRYTKTGIAPPFCIFY